ncbi:MAG: hypothetical protein FJ267_17300, partial [Planctomycetes bacterium]|nr:hypothetical protein [Planctomycetota bacterium]
MIESRLSHELTIVANRLAKVGLRKRLINAWLTLSGVMVLLICVGIITVTICVLTVVVASLWAMSFV